MKASLLEQKFTLIPKNYGKALSLGFSAITGALIAVLADSMTKGQASGFNDLKEGLNNLTGGEVPPLLVLLVLVGLALALCFINEVKTKLNAFTIGATVLSTIVTFTPSPDPIQEEFMPAGSSNTAGRDYGLYSSTDSSLYPIREASYVAQAPSITIRLIQPQGGSAIDSATVTLRDSNGAIISSNVQEGTEFSIYQNAGSYRLIVEVPGYEIVEQNVTLPKAEPLEIRLHSTWIPVPVQRIYR
jgi:hypothetical protein